MKDLLFSTEQLHDPTGIIEGERYEVHYRVSFDEEDELFREEPLGVRALFKIQEGQIEMLSHFIYEPSDESILAFELDEEECIQLLETFQSKQNA